MRQLLFLLFLYVGISSAADPGYVANKRTVSLDTMTPEQAYRVFSLYDQYWSDSGQRIQLILPPITSVSYKILAWEGLRTDPQSYYESIQARIHVGKQAPRFVDSEERVILSVSDTPYSIGYYHGTIAVNTGRMVRVIRVRD